MSGLFDQITNYSPPLLTAGQVNYKGTWSAAANTPTLTSPPPATSKGDYYVVSAAGTQFGITFAVGDWIISNGTAWEKVDLTDSVSSVFGRTGAVVSANGDYTASQVTNVPAGTISSTNVQDAINELSTDISTAQNVLDAIVTNAESVAITKGQVVYAFGATGNRMSVKLALNTSDATSAKTVGVVLDSSIGAGNTGNIRMVGVVDGLNLGAYNDGDTLYLGATAGSVTSTKPYAPNHLVYVGIVERANNGNGQLYVRVQNGYELDEIHDVQITSAPASGALLVRDATNALWKAARLTAGTNIAITNADASVTVGITGIIGSSNGGTGNGFTKFSGPASSEKTFTLPNASSTLLYEGGSIGATTPSTGAFTALSVSNFVTSTRSQNDSSLRSSYLLRRGAGTGSYGSISSIGDGADSVVGVAVDMNGTAVATFNISGGNGAWGATTPSTGAFTTLSATRGSAGVVATLLSGNAAQSPYISFGRASEDLRLQIAAATNDLFTGTVAGDFAVNSNASIWFGTAGNPIAKVSSTGLAVTGTLSASTSATIRSGVTGLVIRDYTAGSLVSLYSTNVTASDTNYSLSFDGVNTYLNGATSARLVAAGTTVASATSTGLAVTGALSASGTATIQGMTVGLGGSAVSVNTAIGVSALAANTTGDNNVAVGRRAGLVNTTGTTNTFIGVDTGISCTTGSRNTLLGAGAGGAITTGSRNTFIGTSNGIDGSCGGFVTTGSANSILGNYTGNQGGLDIRTSSNYIVLSDGDGNPRLIINSGGNVGIGVTPSAWDATLKAITIDGTAVFSGQANAEVVRLGSNWYYNSGFKYQTTGSATIYDQASGKHSWYTAASGTAGNAISFAERMTLTSSGNLLVGTTSGSGNRVDIVGSNGCKISGWGAGVGTGLTMASTTTTLSDAISFEINGTQVGKIQTTSTATLYVTTSDYRRKSNVKDLTGSGAFIDSLKPRTFDWDTGDKGVGFIAHEFAEISPSSVSGEKDAVDAEGNPKYQAMQASSAEVIANLVAELQSLRQRVAALESN